MTDKNFYPESPSINRKNYTRISSSYQNNVMVVLLGIILFFLLYFSALVASFYLIYLAISYDMGPSINKFTILLKIGTIGMSVMFSLFMLKFLFKKQNFNTPLNIEITKDEHPKLFNFIKILSQETNAPFPKKVYLNHEINASVFYNSTILSLFLPVKKNLLIGLGLVNSLNLSEFKAVLAHEFGHFSQSSMRLGSYVYMTNHIIYSMVYDTDKWDETFESWKHSNIQLAIFAWLLAPIIWITRQLMVIIYQGINILQSSLSRQMEYHADLVAVSVTGSDAIVNSLYKLNTHSQTMSFAWEHVNSATHNKIYTSNLFYHQTEAYNYLKKSNKEFRESLLENQKSDRIFVKDDLAGIPAMYSSHPSGYKRENNAKKDYIKGIEDNRSPWILFNEPEKICEKITQNLLKISLELPDAVEFTPAKKVEEFIQSEISETQFSETYLGTYNSRFLSEFDINETDKYAKAYKINPENASAIISEMLDVTLKERALHETKTSEDLTLLNDIITNTNKNKNFIYNGISYHKKDAQQLFEELLKAIDQDQWYDGFDKKMYTAHVLLADPIKKQELKERYNFQISFQKFHKSVIEIQTTLHEKVIELQGAGTLYEDDVNRFALDFHLLRNRFASLIEDVNLTMPPMSNMNKVKSLKEFLSPEKVPVISSNNLDGEKLNKLLLQIEQTVSKTQRLYFKGLGNILNLQEEIRSN
ncbi:M48 family metalloprotease [Leptobacterium flavescens]|uniref:M48 family metalloprotease n=1 Tax=Leptobacterium flavescens TaxID=472055 RepID=A0A6P0UM30_9FLAO|nr:M48 family metallopeptidase [Leptobacterium flavescens]NER12918.1 M48 family metalloprotease [Leptobacterium flavescens]